MDFLQILPILSLLIAAAALARNLRGDTNKEAADMTTVIVKLETINDNVKDLKVEMKDLKADIEKMKERITVCEQSTKSAHKRIDTLHEEHISEE